MSDISAELETLIRNFTSRVVTAVHIQVGERVLAVVAAALTGSQATQAPRLTNSMNPEATAAIELPRKRKLSPEGLAVRKLQGKYLGVLRGLRPVARARVKKVAREKGVAAAIKFASSLQ